MFFDEKSWKTFWSPKFFELDFLQCKLLTFLNFRFSGTFFKNSNVNNLHYKNFDIENFRRPKCFPTFLIDKIFFNFRVFSYDLEISKCCQNTRLARTESRLARPKPGWPARVTSLALSFPARFYSSDWTIYDLLQEGMSWNPCIPNRFELKGVVFKTSWTSRRFLFGFGVLQQPRGHLRRSHISRTYKLVE